MSKAIRCLTQDATVMGLVMDCTDIVAQMETIHRPSAVVTAALGRLLTAASLMGIMLKNTEDSVTLRVDGGGPAGVFTAVSDGLGNVRGCVDEPLADLPIRADGKLDVGGIVGRDGSLYVLRDTGGKEPYTGCVPLTSGEIAEDITYYYAYSEQTPTVCALGVLINPDLTVRAAGGILIQLLPFCPDDVVDKIEANVRALEPVTVMLDKGMTPEQICDAVFCDMPYNEVDRYAPTYRCTCSRERTERILLTMPDEDLRDLPNEEGYAETLCHFCHATYRFTRADIEALIARRRSGK